MFQASQGALVVKNPPASAGDRRNSDLIPGSRGCLEGGHGNPLQYSCVENPHGQRSLAGYSPYGCRVEHDWSDLAHTHTPTHTHPCSRHSISTDNALVSNLYMDHDQRAWVGQIYQNHPTNKWLISLILFLFYSHMTNYNQSYAYKYLRKTKNYMTGETYIIQYSSLFCPLPSCLVKRSQPDLYSFFFFLVCIL